MKVKVESEPKTNEEGLALIKTVIEPEVVRFEKRFRELADSSLTGMEREVLKVYLYQKLTNQL